MFLESEPESFKILFELGDVNILLGETALFRIRILFFLKLDTELVDLVGLYQNAD